MRRAKYGNRKTEGTFHGEPVTFNSGKESRVIKGLEFREIAEEIEDLEIQVPIELVVNGALVCTYVADARFKSKIEFSYKGRKLINGRAIKRTVKVKPGQTVLVDAKGKRTDDYIIKAKLVEAIYGYQIMEI